MDALKKDSRVLGIAPKITAQVFYNVGTIDLTGVINGIDVEAECPLGMEIRDRYYKDIDIVTASSAGNFVVLIPQHAT